MSLVSSAILLFMVMDPFGNVPFFLSVLKGFSSHKRQKIILRELIIALGILIGFLFIGPIFLRLLQISESSLRIAGSIVLLLIAIKMIFGQTEEILGEVPGGEPLIVPLAVPSIAGPSAVATVLFLVAQEPNRRLELMASLGMAWVGVSVILLASVKIAYFLGERCLAALERLMGLILTAMSVEMFLQGIRIVFGA